MAESILQLGPFPEDFLNNYGIDSNTSSMPPSLVIVSTF